MGRGGNKEAVSDKQYLSRSDSNQNNLNSQVNKINDSISIHSKHPDLIQNTETIKTKLYRAGGTVKAKNYGEAHQAFAAADQVKPEGRVGRLEGLFCSVDISDLSKWTLATSGAGSEYDPRPRELNYSGLEPYVYPADGWLDATSSFDSLKYLLKRENRSATEQELEFFKSQYWNKGILLSEYIQNRHLIDQEHVWRGGGEVLIDPASITSKRNVSLQRILKYTEDYNLISMKRLFKRWRWN
jgi:hypothetical protein